ncbi:MAG: hypothetical protein JKY43_07885 [Phycisphaerales bacterium]|nr:hypothetical protein [Phycisphaerales bacterium]
MSKFVKKAEKDLCLETSDQDWGLVNADYSRVNEFVEYFKSNRRDDCSSKVYNDFIYNMTELIIESVLNGVEKNGELSAGDACSIEKMCQLAFGHHALEIAKYSLQQGTSASDCIVLGVIERWIGGDKN